MDGQPNVCLDDESSRKLIGRLVGDAGRLDSCRRVKRKNGFEVRGRQLDFESKDLATTCKEYFKIFEKKKIDIPSV